MTRLLILSDSHGKIAYIDDILRKHNHQFDLLIHLGDQCSDMVSFLPSLDQYYLVRGNMESHLSDIEENPYYKKEGLEIKLEGLSIFLTHGHRFSLHATSVFLHKESIKKGYQLVLHGHTHKKRNEVVDGIHYFNPGALTDRDYGMITLDNQKVVEAKHLHLTEKW